MQSKIINPSRYKKVDKNKKRRRDHQVEDNIKAGRMDVPAQKIVKDKKIKDKKIREPHSFVKKVMGVFVALATLTGIYFISSFLVSLSSGELLNVFSNDGKKITVNVNYDLKMGTLHLDREHNVLVKELDKHSYASLLSYDKDGIITYNIAKKITKLDPLHYEIVLKDVKYLEAVKEILKGYTFAIEQDKITVTLKEQNPYFPYLLSGNIIAEAKYKKNVLENEVSYQKNTDINEKFLTSIQVKNYATSSSMLTDFKEGKIDVMLTSLEEDLRRLGKYEYNAKKYRNGETIFLFFNKNNLYLQDKDIRKVIVNSLNRSEIVKGITGFAEVIDIPYIGSKLEYKYDVYSAENSLIAHSFVKKDGIYTKNQNSLTFRLLVNEKDEQKVMIAEKIKQMLEKIGIRVNIEKTSDVQTKVKQENYDMVLSTVSLNDHPDISFLYEYIAINEGVKEAITRVENVSVEELKSAMDQLKRTLYDEYACVGIMAKNTYVISQKNIYGFENISYQSIFNELNQIGKIQ